MKKKSEIEEAESSLKEMVKTLNELPTDVLTTLNDNLEKIEAFNKKHNLNTGSSHGAYTLANIEELYEANDEFLSICVLGEHVKTRLVPMDAPLEAIMLFKTQDDVKEWAKDREWVDYVAYVKSFSCSIKEHCVIISIIDTWGISITLTLLSLDCPKDHLPKELISKLFQGFRIAKAKEGYGEEFFKGILENQ